MRSRYQTGDAAPPACVGTPTGGHRPSPSTRRSVRCQCPRRRLDCVPAVNLGMPRVPEVLAPRRKTRQIKVGKVLVGGDAPISVQSMTTTPTTNINATLQQIAELTASGCEIVRVAVPSQDDADVLHIIATKSQILACLPGGQAHASPTKTSGNNGTETASRTARHMALKAVV